MISILSSSIVMDAIESILSLGILLVVYGLIAFVLVVLGALGILCFQLGLSSPILLVMGIHEFFTEWLPNHRDRKRELDKIRSVDRYEFEVNDDTKDLIKYYDNKVSSMTNRSNDATVILKYIDSIIHTLEGEVRSRSKSEYSAYLPEPRALGKTIDDLTRERDLLKSNMIMIPAKVKSKGLKGLWKINTLKSY